MKKSFSIIFALFFAMLIISGCGKDSKKEAPETVTTTVTESESYSEEKSEPARVSKSFADGVIIYNNVGLWEVNPADKTKLRWIGSLPKGQLLQVEAEPGKVIEGVKVKYPWLLNKDKKTTDMACVKLDNSDTEYYVAFDCVIGNARPCIMIGKDTEGPGRRFGNAYTEMKATKISKISIPAGTIGAIHTGADVDSGWVKATFRVEAEGDIKPALYVEKFYKEDQISTDEYDVLLEMLLQREEQLKEPDEAVTERIRYLSDIDAPNDDIIRGHYK